MIQNVSLITFKTPMKKMLIQTCLLLCCICGWFGVLPNVQVNRLRSVLDGFLSGNRYSVKFLSCSKTGTRYEYILIFIRQHCHFATSLKKSSFPLASMTTSPKCRRTYDHSSFIICSVFRPEQNLISLRGMFQKF